MTLYVLVFHQLNSFIVSTDLHLRLVRLVDHGLENCLGRNFVYLVFSTLFLRMELGLMMDADSGIRWTFALT